MPCKKCANGKYKWGDSGKCEYDSLEQCEQANAGHKEYLPRSEWADKAKSGGLNGEGIKQGAIAEVVKAPDSNDDAPILRFIISTADKDRDNDTIDQDGWDLVNYMKNPVVLFVHDSRSPAVGKSNNLFFENNNFKSDTEFMPRDMYPFSYMLYRMYLGKFMRATSVGFSAKEWDWNDETGGIDFKKQELHEYSLVPVPANPNAVMEAKSTGIDTSPLIEWAEQLLDGELTESGILLPSKMLEKMRKDAGAPNRVIILANKDGVEVQYDTGSQGIDDDKGGDKEGNKEIDTNEPGKTEKTVDGKANSEGVIQGENKDDDSVEAKKNKNSTKNYGKMDYTEEENDEFLANINEIFAKGGDEQDAFLSEINKFFEDGVDDLEGPDEFISLWFDDNKPE